MKEKIVKFRKPTTTTPQKKMKAPVPGEGGIPEPFTETVQDRCRKDLDSLLKYRMNPLRFKPMSERPRYDPEKDSEEFIPMIYYFVGGFKSGVQKLINDGVLNGDLFPGSYDYLRKVASRLPDGAMDAIHALPLRTRAEIVMEICRNVHDGFVRNYAEDFFCVFMDSEYVFLPVELIGVHQLSLIYEPTVELLEPLGLEEVSWEELVKVYDGQRIRFFRGNHVKNADDMTTCILKIADTYPALRADIRKVMSSREMAFHISRQVIAQSAEILLELWAEKKSRNSIFQAQKNMFSLVKK